MCHYMLPNRSLEQRGCRSVDLDGRYADEAMEMLYKEMNKIGAPRSEYHIKLFGGGNMFPNWTNSYSNIGNKNAETARKLVSNHGLNCVAEHLGGNGHRHIIFDVWSGFVWVKHVVTDQVRIGD